MLWNTCFILSVLILIGSVLYARGLIFHDKKERLLSPFYTIFAGVLIAVFVGLIPVFINMLSDESGAGAKLILFDAIQTLQVFTGDAGYDPIYDNINSAATAISGLYSTYMSCLFFAAPVLTFGFLISLFKNVFTGLRYRLHYLGDVFVFSVLNEKSLTLAKSIREKNPKAVLVFTDVDNDEEDASNELVEQAKEIHAMLTHKDILSMDFQKHSDSAQFTFFTIAENENDNLIKSLKLLEKYHTRKNTDLYVFSTGEEGELFLSNAAKGQIKLRRINSVRSLIYNFLYDEGERLFANAVPCQTDSAEQRTVSDSCQEDAISRVEKPDCPASEPDRTASTKKAIHALILGMGQHGKEIIKALSWYGQMDGYTIEIDAYDQEVSAEETFTASCPELMSEKYNGKDMPGECSYCIRIHSGMDIRTKSCLDSISSLKDLTFVFVSLGDDAENIKQAAKIRMLCERNGSKPIIKAVVKNPEAKEAITGVTNYRGQAYGIEAIGDIESMYSQEILMGTELEKLALERHLRWGSEEEFWQYEYNYQSSMATAIHLKARIASRIPGADQAAEDLTEQELIKLEELEHRRWNAYMRSEGYVFSGSRDKSSRNDLAKMHHDLVPFAMLSEEEKEKDKKVGTV